MLYISYIAKHLITALLPKLTVIHKNGNAQSPPGSFLLPQSVTIYIQIWVAKLLAIVTPLKQLCEQMFDTKAHLMPFRVLYYWLKMILGISWDSLRQLKTGEFCKISVWFSKTLFVKLKGKPELNLVVKIGHIYNP